LNRFANAVLRHDFTLISTKANDGRVAFIIDAVNRIAYDHRCGPLAFEAQSQLPQNFPGIDVATVEHARVVDRKDTFVVNDSAGRTRPQFA
jgi:hypothetical protein